MNGSISDVYLSFALYFESFMPSLYRSSEAVTAQWHRHVCLLDAESFELPASAGALPVVVKEFGLVGRHHPIVFAAETLHLPVILLRLTGQADAGRASAGARGR